MNEIQRVLRVASLRLFANGLVRSLIVAFSAAVAVLMGALIVQRVFGLSVSWGDWGRLAGALAGAAVLGGLAWSLAVRARGVRVAREVDERADLRESLSTAVCFAASEDPWARAVVETARDRATRVDIRRTIPIEAPRFWPVPPALALALAIIYWSFPPLDIFGHEKERRQAREEARQVEQVSAEVKKADEQLREALQRARVDLGDEGAEENAEGATPEPRNADDIRRAAVRKLTSTQEKLGELKSGERAQKMDALREALRQLKQPGPGPMDEMFRSLAKGDFKGAQQQLDELSRKLGDSSLSPDQKQQLQKQMEKLAQQMDKLAQDRSALERKLEQAGLNKDEAKKLAMSPEALKQALENAKNLSEEQKKQLMQAAKAMQSACQSCEGMSGALGQMAKGMGESGMNAEGMQGMEGMADMLSGLEMAQAEMEGLEAAIKLTKVQLAGLCDGMCEGEGEGEPGDEARIGPWRPGDSRRAGVGSGGPGRGNGPSTDAVDSDVTIDKVKSPTKLGNGPIIGSRLVYGDQVRGESVAEITAAVEAAGRAATEAVETMQVPREFQGAVQSYFGNLPARIKATRGLTDAPAPAPAPSEPAPGDK